MKKAVFLDRDNTIIHDPGYLDDPEKVEILDGVPAALKKMHKAGYDLIIISNQSGVGRGYMAEEVVHEINDRVAELLAEEHVIIKGFYICPHHPDAGCSCRKPKPGMILKAAEEHDIDLSRSYMIGDKYSDYQAGLAAGVRSLLVLSGPDSERDSAQVPKEDVVRDLRKAAELVLNT